MKCCARSLTSCGFEPDNRVAMAPSTKMRAGPSPCASNAIVFPSFDLSVFISAPRLTMALIM